MRYPILIFLLFWGTPENAGVMLRFRPLMGLREGKSEVTHPNLVPFVGDPRECGGYVAIQPLWRHLRRRG